MATMFTGQYPDRTKTTRLDFTVGASPLLARLLRDAGYDTYAFSANRILNRDNPRTAGFERFRFSAEKPALHLIRFYQTDWNGPAFRGHAYGEPTYDDTYALTRMLGDFRPPGRGRPYFLWAHYMDPHGPYAPPPGYYEARDAWLIAANRPWEGRYGKGYKRLYDGECRFMDDQLALVLPKFLADPNAVVILTADHGEEFWEHGELTYGHGKSVYDTLVRIPLVVFVPRTPAARVNMPVSLVDLAPTVLALAGVPAPKEMQGKPFLTADGAPLTGDRDVYVGSAFFKVAAGKPERMDALVRWPYKLLIYHERPDAPGEYYKLDEDDGERRPLADDEPGARAMRADLRAWAVANGAGEEEASYGGAAAPDLKALGYIK